MLKKILTIALAALLLAVPAHAQIIGATGSQSGGGNSSYREKGSSLRLEAGWLGAAVGYVYQLNPYVMLGGGITLYDEMGLMPYVEARMSTPKQQHALFLDFKLGPVIDGGYGNDFGSTLTLGYMYKNWSLGIGASFGGETFPIVNITYSLPFSTIKNIFL